MNSLLQPTNSKLKTQNSKLKTSRNPIPVREPDGEQGQQHQAQPEDDLVGVAIAPYEGQHHERREEYRQEARGRQQRGVRGGREEREDDARPQAEAVAPPQPPDRQAAQ